MVVQTFCLAQNSFEKPKVFTEKNLVYGALIDEESKFIAGDNPAFALPNYNDSAWKYADFSSKKTYDKDQVYWIRYYFKIDSASVNKSLCFDVKQVGASEIYLNGKKIETIGKIGKSGAREFRIKNNIPELFSLDNTQVNVLAIRFLPIVGGKKWQSITVL